MGQGSMACVRYLLFGFNLCILFFGVLLIYSGLSTFITVGKYDFMIHNSPDTAAIVLLVVGFAVFITSFAGCCGAIANNSFMLRTFSFIITVLLIIELVSVSVVFAFKKTIHSEMIKGINEAIVKYNETDMDNVITRFVDDIQTNFHCCGATSPDNWHNNTHYRDIDSLPQSCCSRDMPNGTICSIGTHFHYQDGCVEIITDELKSSVSFLGWTGIAVIAIQVIGVIFSCMLANEQRRQYTYV